MVINWLCSSVITHLSPLYWRNYFLRIAFWIVISGVVGGCIAPKNGNALHPILVHMPVVGATHEPMGLNNPGSLK